MRYFTVEGIHNGMAALENDDGERMFVAVQQLPICREGDVLCETDGVFTVSENETAQRREAAFSLEQKLRGQL